MVLEQVREAKQALESAGKKVTDAALLAHIGGGSKRDLSRLRKQLEADAAPPVPDEAQARHILTAAQAALDACTAPLEEDRLAMEAGLQLLRSLEDAHRYGVFLDQDPGLLDHQAAARARIAQYRESLQSWREADDAVCAAAQALTTQQHQSIEAQRMAYVQAHQPALVDAVDDAQEAMREASERDEGGAYHRHKYVWNKAREALNAALVVAPVGHEGSG